MYATLIFVPLRDRVGNSRQSIDENNESYDGGREEPRRVETNPCEVDTYLFTKVAPKGWSMLGNKAQMSVRVSLSLSLSSLQLSPSLLSFVLPLSLLISISSKGMSGIWGREVLSQMRVKRAENF